ncbi:GNAT family N-acetyltransferase [Nonomuraea rubra]
MLIAEVSPADDPLGSQLLALQQASYAIEAELIKDDRIPPLHESLDELRAQPLLWLAAMVGGDRLAGAVAWQETPAEVDINRLIVHPDLLRQGIGRTLVKEVIARAGERRIVVSTGRDNAPARALYERLGFGLRGELEVIPGLWIAQYGHPSA